MKRLGLVVLAVLVLLVVGTLIQRTTGVLGAAPSSAGPNSNGVTQSTTPPPATPATTVPTAIGLDASAVNASMQHAYAVANPSVVYVVSQGVGSGSGVIYDTQGDIVTNNHVISGASSIRVTLSSGKSYAAHVVGTDAADDLAVIKISASGLTPAHFASAGGSQVADLVLAIGSPLGLQDSVSSGVISGLNRVEQEPNGSYIPNAIQTSAPINPGNSGGALVTLDGTVVGIPTLVQTGTGSGEPVQDVGFAIPSSRVTYVANQIIATGKVENTGRASLGVSVTDAENADRFPFGQGTPPVQGALIEQVGSGSPASKAGLQVGDVITSFNGQPITGQQTLLTALAHAKPGETVQLQLNRTGSTMKVSVRLGQLPANS
jgi:putative serine protease PepD